MVNSTLVRRIVVAAAVLAATSFGVAAPVHAMPIDRGRTIVTVWHRNSYGWYGYSNYGPPQQIASEPSDLHDGGQSNTDGTITTWHQG